jgi:SAM-dependent methyltransferase
MIGYDDTTYGERIADAYDDLYEGHEEVALDLLEELAAGGRVLELGIGTGRVALPLAARGLYVVGIDASPAMIEKLRAKPGGDEIRVVKGSFAEIRIDEQFELIFVVFNTFFALLTQEEQVACFRSVAAHLTAGGHFLIEAFVPDLARFEDHQAVRVVELSDELVRLDAAEHDIVNQQIASQHIFISERATRIYPVRLRYAWPSELDLMAPLAGLALEHRWGSWQKDEFTRESEKHISVYTQAG